MNLPIVGKTRPEGNLPGRYDLYSIEKPQDAPASWGFFGGKICSSKVSRNSLILSSMPVLNTLQKDGLLPYLLSRFFAGESERGSRL
jgi:hypothetical protein